MAATLILNAQLDLATAKPLLKALRAHQGEDLDVDASCVSHMGALCLQVLLSAFATWDAEGKTIRLTSPTDACLKQLAFCGLSPENLAPVRLGGET